MPELSLSFSDVVAADSGGSLRFSGVVPEPAPAREGVDDDDPDGVAVGGFVEDDEYPPPLPRLGCCCCCGDGACEEEKTKDALLPSESYGLSC